MAQLMPLPLTVSCFSKIQIGFTFLVPAHQGSPGKGPLNGCVTEKSSANAKTITCSGANTKASIHLGPQNSYVSLELHFKFCTFQKLYIVKLVFVCRLYCYSVSELILCQHIHLLMLQVKAYVMLSCTNGVSPNHLPVIVASNRQQCWHMSINKIWRWTESTPLSGRWHSHMAGIYSDCSTREINNNWRYEWRNDNWYNNTWGITSETTSKWVV